MQHTTIPTSSMVTHQCEDTTDPNQHEVKYILSSLYGLLTLAASIILLLVWRAHPAERCRVPLHSFVTMSALGMWLLNLLHLHLHFIIILQLKRYMLNNINTFIRSYIYIYIYIYNHSPLLDNDDFIIYIYQISCITPSPKSKSPSYILDLLFILYN